jgi:V/A-type H+-transporting ATPase subunit D
MELKFQYNKTALNEIKGHLVLRETALPILKNKETALRQEVKNTNDRLKELKSNLESTVKKQDQFARFWLEFPDIVSIDTLQVKHKKIVGVKVPEVEEINYNIQEISWFSQPAWIPAGIEIMKDLIRLRIEIEVTEKQLNLLYQTRKKTTQKVNLYEKVQIPALEKAILKIKRFLEDEENISKAAQKIVKKRNDQKGVLA